MGAGNSKPTGRSEYVFKAESPVNFTHKFLETLHTDLESDSTRAKSLQLHIQSRVENELQKIRASEIEKINEIAEKLSREMQHGSVSAETKAELQKYDNNSGGAATDPSSSKPGLLDRVASVFESAEAAEARRRHSLSRETVLSQIKELQTKLADRKEVQPIDPAVSKAKDNLVTCLRLKDRRPLECWEEVEKFKAEVARIEHKAIEKVLG